jgi:hypothetical protein
MWVNSNCYELFLEAFEFLTYFCAGNTENQQALFVDIDFFLSFLQPHEHDGGLKKSMGSIISGGDIFSQNVQVTSTSQDAFLRRSVPGLCIEIFRNNRAICSQITEYPYSLMLSLLTLSFPHSRLHTALFSSSFPFILAQIPNQENRERNHRHWEMPSVCLYPRDHRDREWSPAAAQPESRDEADHREATRPVGVVQRTRVCSTKKCPHQSKRTYPPLFGSKRKSGGGGGGGGGVCGQILILDPLGLLTLGTVSCAWFIFRLELAEGGVLVSPTPVRLRLSCPMIVMFAPLDTWLFWGLSPRIY